MEANQKLEESMSRVIDDEEIDDDHHNKPNEAHNTKVKTHEILLTQEDRSVDSLEEEVKVSHTILARPTQINRFAYESFL